jgi:hypothetical protein
MSGVWKELNLMRFQSEGFMAVESTMTFADTATDSEHRFSIGRETESGRFYLSIPVSNGLVDYEEYYEISTSDHNGYPANATALREFAEQCRNRQHDNLLLIRPGTNRGAV